jgi:anti-sigma B factor antagonist
MRPDNAESAGMTGKPAEIDACREGESMTVAVAGEIDASTAGELDAAIREAEQTEISRIVVDLSDLSFIDSTALEVLLRASIRHRQNGNRLSFVPSTHESVTMLIALTCTAEMFE